MKTTGVSDIPKFGLLDFLGHPSADSSLLFTCKDGLLNLNESLKFSVAMIKMSWLISRVNL